MVVTAVEVLCLIVSKMGVGEMGLTPLFIQYFEILKH